jgi:cyclin-dependent kinase-like
MENYENLGTIGEGTYGLVLKARHKATGKIVAIKKFKESDEDEQVQKTALREIRILKQLRHDNIVSLLDVFRRNGKLYLVFEYVQRTILEDLEANPSGLDYKHVKSCFYQLLQSLDFIHSHNVIHRDIKPENLLVSRNGVLKLCDFGFARTLARPGAKYTDYVATRWYRAPELLVGDADYGKGVDVWAAACMFAEILSGTPLFPGESDLDQLYHITKSLGELPPRQLEIFQKNPLYVGVTLPAVTCMEPLAMKLRAAERGALAVLTGCLKYDPDERPTCKELLNSEFFHGFAESFAKDFEKSVRLDRELSEREMQQYCAQAKARGQKTKETKDKDKGPRDGKTEKNRPPKEATGGFGCPLPAAALPPPGAINPPSNPNQNPPVSLTISPTALPAAHAIHPQVVEGYLIPSSGTQSQPNLLVRASGKENTLARDAKEVAFAANNPTKAAERDDEKLSELAESSARAYEPSRAHSPDSSLDDGNFGGNGSRKPEKKKKLKRSKKDAAKDDSGKSNVNAAPALAGKQAMTQEASKRASLPNLRAQLLTAAAVPPALAGDGLHNEGLTEAAPATRRADPKDDASAKAPPLTRHPSLHVQVKDGKRDYAPTSERLDKLDRENLAGTTGRLPLLPAGEDLNVRQDEHAKEEVEAADAPPVDGKQPGLYPQIKTRQLDKPTAKLVNVANESAFPKVNAPLEDPKAAGKRRAKQGAGLSQTKTLIGLPLPQFLTAAAAPPQKQKPTYAAVAANARLPGPGPGGALAIVPSVATPSVYRDGYPTGAPPTSHGRGGLASPIRTPNPTGYELSIKPKTKHKVSQYAYFKR